MPWLRLTEEELQIVRQSLGPGAANIIFERAVAAMAPRLSDVRYCFRARKLYGTVSGVEIEPDLVVSRNDDMPERGAYVLAWVWVNKENEENDEEEDND